MTSKEEQRARARQYYDDLQKKHVREEEETAAPPSMKQRRSKAHDTARAATTRPAVVAPPVAAAPRSKTAAASALTKKEWREAQHRKNAQRYDRGELIGCSSNKTTKTTPPRKTLQRGARPTAATQVGKPPSQQVQLTPPCTTSNRGRRRSPAELPEKPSFIRRPKQDQPDMLLPDHDEDEEIRLAQEAERQQAEIEQEARRQEEEKDTTTFSIGGLLAVGLGILLVFAVNMEWSNVGVVEWSNLVSTPAALPKHVTTTVRCYRDSPTENADDDNMTIVPACQGVPHSKWLPCPKNAHCLGGAIEGCMDTQHCVLSDNNDCV